MHACAGRTIPDPELPDSDEVLFFCLVNLDFTDSSEVKRVTSLEISGGIDQDGLKEFIKADPNQTA